MLFLIDFNIEYPTTMSQQELFKIWTEEADAVLDAKKAGTIVDLWKCVGERRIIAIVNVDSPDEMDDILLDLPIMKKLGQHVHVNVTSLRKYEDFALDVKSRLK